MQPPDDTLSPEPPAFPLKASVIVPVRNGAGVLPKLLEGLAAQTLPAASFEVIVGDDGSTDRGIQGIETSDERIRVTVGPPLTSDAARNRAARLARSDVLAFCDADCIPSPTWLETGLAAIQRTAASRPVSSAQSGQNSPRSGRSSTSTPGSTRSGWSNGGPHRRRTSSSAGSSSSASAASTRPSTTTAISSSSRVAGRRVPKLAFCRDATVTTTTYDDYHSFFRKAWAVNHAYGWHEGRQGRKPGKLKAREWVPFVQPLRSRRRSGSSVLLDRKCLSENGFQARPWQDAAALPIQYLALPYIACVGQSVGWWHGRQLVEQTAATTGGAGRDPA